ncbi:MAG: hypothetical protein HY905_12530 [Deltaproteobacteria bacterium]|nr:hypothetical protein [Deltaproteobacteria bacterium]
MNGIKAKLIVFVIVGPVATGCLADDESEEAIRADACTTICGKAEMCWSEGVDEAECYRECVRDRRWSSVEWEAERRCYEDLSCPDLENRDEVLLCFRIERGDVEPTDHGLAYCHDLVAACVRCDGSACVEDDVRRECYGEVPRLGIDYLTSASRCFREQACDAIDDCRDLVRAAYGG